MLADLIRRNANLKTLRVLANSLFESQVFLYAVVANLTWSESPMRCLEFGLGIPITALRTAMTAVSNSSRLEHLIINSFLMVEENYVQVLLESFPSFKVKEITLKLYQGNLNQELLLQAVKCNYIVQSMNCELRHNGDNFFTAANQSRLEFCMERNRKLAALVKKPKMVPRDLWQYGIMLALEARINSFFQSLLALSQQGTGLRRPGRKRKRSQYYKPSSA